MSASGVAELILLRIGDAVAVSAFDVRSCEGFRRTALTDATGCTWAVVGKAPVKEPAAMWAHRRLRRYGD